MSTKQKGVPKGFAPVDKTVMKARMENLTPVEKGMQSLMVADRDIRGNRDRDEKSKADYRKVRKLSDIISNNTQASTDLRSVTQLIKRAEDLWVTLLLKPNGDQRNILNFLTENTDMKNVELHDNLISSVKKYFTTQYPFEKDLAQIIKDVMFRSGSYALLNMSHSVLDHLINGYEMSLETSGNEGFERGKAIFEKHFDGSFKKAKNLGYIRKTPNNALADAGGMESLWGVSGNASAGSEYNLVEEGLNWTFTDNPIVMRAAELRQTLTSRRLRSVTGNETLRTVMGQVFETGKKQLAKAKKEKNQNNNKVGIASIEDSNKIIAELYPKRNYRYSESLSVRRSRFYTGSGKGIGITYHVPSEACIPVHANGDIGNPFGYILLTDPDTGEFLRTVGDMKFYQGSQSGTVLKNGVGSINEMASHIKAVAQGRDCAVDMSWMVEFASATLEKELAEGFINGDLRKSVTISLTEHNKKLFLGRAFRQQGVRCVFVPAEYMTYIATEFNALGTGRSLVEEAKLHITRLAVLETADALANIENSISHTELSIVLEKQNPDARNLVAMVRDEWFANNPTLHDIIGFNNVSIDAVLDRFKEQSLTIRVDAGENRSVIAPEINAHQMEREPLKTIDPSTREQLLNVISGYFNLKRSWLDDSGEGNDFQVEALAEQEMLRNQTAELSDKFSRFFSDFMRKHIMCNEPLVTDLLKTIKENAKLYEKTSSQYSLEEIAEAEGLELEGKLTEEEKVEMVFLDFLKSFYVELPKPAITDTLNKIDDKIEAIDKLVERWTQLMGGAKAIERLAAEINVEPDLIISQVKGAMLADAFQRFNIPMPFEEVLNDGDGGGIFSMVDSITNLETNTIKFLEAYVNGNKKTNKLLEKLKAKSDEINGEKPDESAEPSNPGMLEEQPGGGFDGGAGDFGGGSDFGAEDTGATDTDGSDMSAFSMDDLPAGPDVGSEGGDEAGAEAGAEPMAQSAELDLPPDDAGVDTIPDDETEVTGDDLGKDVTPEPESDLEAFGPDDLPPADDEAVIEDQDQLDNDVEQGSDPEVIEGDEKKLEEDVVVEEEEIAPEMSAFDESDLPPEGKGKKKK
ncbi:virion structural protein [Aeromonas phage D3]|uniref:Virion structural protein n=1 Tax=Aeromonas phage D3 TaxID=2593327 RepID=A0A514TVQ1_9CAUD|nr:virion structural protein [Aeromonas phage D3]QDJ97105.1 hypothetical protein D3_0107 [Aeromonas phage D3]